MTSSNEPDAKAPARAGTDPIRKGGPLRPYAQTARSRPLAAEASLEKKMAAEAPCHADHRRERNLYYLKLWSSVRISMSPQSRAAFYRL